jgi:hypothetical protein
MHINSNLFIKPVNIQAALIVIKVHKYFNLFEVKKIGFFGSQKILKKNIKNIVSLLIKFTDLTHNKSHSWQGYCQN